LAIVHRFINRKKARSQPNPHRTLKKLPYLHPRRCSWPPEVICIASPLSSRERNGQRDRGASACR
ncbi:MAG: hypothetical protein ACOC3G_06350, partial [Phycisphaeraceae bacterium]